MAVDSALRYAGATAGKKNRRGFVVRGLRCLVLLVFWNFIQDFVEGRTTPEPFADGQECLNSRLAPAKEKAGQMCLWNTNKDFGLGFSETGFEVFNFLTGQEKLH